METHGRKPLNQLPASKMLACAITGNEEPKKELIRLDTLRPGLIERIRTDFPELEDSTGRWWRASRTRTP